MDAGATSADGDGAQMWGRVCVGGVASREDSINHETSGL